MTELDRSTRDRSSGVDFANAGLTGVRFEALLETIPLSIAVFDSELKLRSANTQYHELTGVEAPASARMSIYDAFPNALADLTEQIDAALRGVTDRAAERVPFHHRNGRRLIETTFTAIGEDSGSRSILFAGNDVSEREELRGTLGRSVAQLESIFDVIPDSVRVVDVDGRTVRSNTQALQDHAGNGTPPSTLRELWQLDRPRTMEGTSLFMHEHPTARALRGERVRGETLLVRRGVDGAPVIIEVNSNPLFDEQGKIRGAVTVERDVTAKTQLAKALEEEVRRTAELYERVSTEAERLERMVQERTAELLTLQEARARERRLAAVGQLAAGVMHDVNNALNPIMAAAYLLETNADNPAAVRDYAIRIAKAAETGAATAARVGRFIRQEPLQSEREEAVDLSLVCDEVVAMTRPLWAERARGGTVKLHRDLGRGAIIRGLGGEIREALLNLVQNSLDAMPDGGTLGLRTALENGEARLEVSDSGMGMTAEVRERAFEPFFTTKGRAGTGLGLAEVYGIVKRHRGRAEIRPNPGKGTTISMIFPAASQASASSAGSAVEARRRTPRRVLLVEDHVDSREFMQALLESDGHRVDSAGGVVEALARLEQPGASYEVLVTDIGLSDGSGWELIAAVRERWPNIRIGVVTGWEPGGVGAGTDGDFILRKPVRTSELLAKVAAEG